MRLHHDGISYFFDIGEVMTNTQRIAMQQAQQALDALEYAHATNRYESARQDLAIAALRKALAEQEVEPVGYASIEDLRQLQNCNGIGVWCESPSMWGTKEQAPPPPENLVAIYTAPRPMHFQEPVAWAHDRFIENDDGMRIGTDEPELRWGKYVPDDGGDWFPLYTSPQPPAEVPLLTDYQISCIAVDNPPDVYTYARAIEQAVRQKAGIK